MVGSPGCGRIALTHIARILPGVSFPSRVVRSIIEMARLSAHSFDAFLIERRLSASTRSSTPTWSTAVTRPSRLPSGPGRPSQARISSLARSRTAESGRLVAVMGRRGYTSARADPRGTVGSRSRPGACAPEDRARRASTGQNPQNGEAGSSIRAGAPTGSNRVTITTASTVPSLRPTWTSVPSSRIASPAWRTSGVQVGSSAW